MTKIDLGPRSKVKNFLRAPQETVARTRATQRGRDSDAAKKRSCPLTLYLGIGLSCALEAIRGVGRPPQIPAERAEVGPFAEVEYLVPSMVCEGCAEKIGRRYGPCQECGR